MEEVTHTFEANRNGIVDQILNYVSDESGLPQSIFIYGASGTGKTKVVSSLIRHSIQNAIIVNCNECFSSKILFETILNGVFDHKPSSDNQYSPYAKCNSARDFFDALEQCNASESYVIVIDAAEMLSKMEHNILPIFLRLQELSDLNVCCVLISTLHIDLMTPKDGLESTIVIYWPQYTQKEIFNIMLDKFDDYKTFVKQKLVVTDGNNVSDSEAIVEAMDVNFFESFLHLFLNVTLRSCRNIRELLLTSRDCFQKYCEPILKQNVKMTDIQKLYRNISDVLKNSTKKTFETIEDSNQVKTTIFRCKTLPQDFNLPPSVQITSDLGSTKMQQLELPFYAKYLLIAAFLASHNDAKLDKRLFMKNHGKQRKRLQDIKSKAVV